jgi:triosephosphate isomerase
MYKTVDEALDFVNALAETAIPDGVEAVLCAPFTALPALVPAAEKCGIGIGAQNVHWEKEGAFTGEVSVPMLAALGVKYVIIGHSERRAYFAETDGTVNLKVKAALSGGLIPIVCVGETLKEREGDRTQETVGRQVRQAFAGLSPAEMETVIIAYEPVWAIGTGKAATAEDAEEVIRFIRGTVAELFGGETAEKVRIQYGGSVKPENVGTFLSQPDIDGALVGGASLEPHSFLKLVNAAKTGG